MSKIVVVVDSYAELQMIEGYLKSANHTVISYPNTDKLEEKLAADKPDVIVLDVVMPGRNGFQACRDLKSDDRFKNIPIVLLTARVQESDIARGFEAGADDYIKKPFSPQELRARVQAILGRR